MLNKQNNFVLFCKNHSFLLTTSICLFICFFPQAQAAVASRSDQLCDNELEEYCPNSQYPTTELKMNCIDEKRQLFSYECLAKVFGLHKKETENTDIDKEIINNETTYDIQNEDALLELDINDEQNKYINIKSQLQKEQENNLQNEKKIDQQNKQIKNLTTMVINKNCITEVRKFCKTKIRRRNIVLKESLEKCIDKMIKHENYLTINCRSALLNILNKTSNKQYKVYRIANVNIISGQSLKNAKKKLDN